MDGARVRRQGRRRRGRDQRDRRAAAVAFAAAKVVVAGRREPEGEEAVALARAGGGEATFLRTDVTSEDDVTALMDSTVERYGGLDSAFNNAGRDLNVGVADASLEDFSGRRPRQA